MEAGVQRTKLESSVAEATALRPKQLGGKRQVDPDQRRRDGSNQRDEVEVHSGLTVQNNRLMRRISDSS
jgi:hypothetical protein